MIAALTAAVFVLRADQMVRQSLYGDELWTFQQVTNVGLSGLFHNIRPPGENAPPVFFLMAWLSAKFGAASVLIRLPSLLLGVATIPVLFWLGCETLGPLSGVCGAGIFALSPFATYYGIEARPYAAMACFVTLTLLAAVRITRQPSLRGWVLYVLAAAAAAYTGYTAIFPLIVIGIWTLWAHRRQLRSALIAHAAIVVLYLPWLSHVHSRSLWIIGALEPFSTSHVLDDSVRALAGNAVGPLSAIPTLPGLILLALLVVGGLGLRLRGRAPAASSPVSHLGLVVAVALAAPVGLILYSLISTDIWDPRDLFASVPAACLFFGWLISGWPRRLRPLILALVAGVLLLGLVRSLSPAWARPPFKAASAYINRNVSTSDPVVVLPTFLNLADDLPPELTGTHRLIYGMVPGDLSLRAHGRVATVGSLGSPPSQAAARTLTQQGEHVVAQHRYGGVFPFVVTIWGA